MAEATLKEVLEAFEHLEKELTADKIRAAGNPCDVYGKIRPWLLLILPWIDKIAKKVADVIRFLMGIADNFCKIPNP